MPKNTATKSSVERRNLKKQLTKDKLRNVVVNKDPFEQPTQKNSVSYLWRKLLIKPSKNSVKGGCPHNLSVIFEKFYEFNKSIICSNDKNYILYDDAKSSSSNGEIIRELNFEDLEIDWGNKKLSKTQLVIQYNTEEPIVIELHRRGGTTFQKDLRPATYDTIDNNLNTGSTSKRKSERLFNVSRNRRVVLPINNKVDLEFELQTSCNDPVDKKFSNVVGCIGLCMGQNDIIRNIIVFRTNLKGDDSYLASKIRIINKVAPNYEDKLQIGKCEIFLSSLHATNYFRTTPINNDINMVNNSLQMSHNGSPINGQPTFQSQHDDNWNQQLEQFNASFQTQPTNQHEQNIRLLENYNALLYENRELIKFVEFVAREYPHVIVAFNSAGLRNVPILEHTLSQIFDPVNTTPPESPSLPANSPFTSYMPGNYRNV